MRTATRSGPARALLPAIVWFAALCVLSEAADAQRKERLGKEVVDAICASCHAAGKDNAPRIGDAKAWAGRASQGLAALNEHALQGIRKMPAHGGGAGFSDIEVERAIIYMINQSGGHWVEPLGGATPAVVRSSETIVQNQCAKCHQTGQGGAPRIGDRAAWIPRLKKGLDPLVASAIHGHGPMPARGGLPDLSDQEIRGAVIYMFNYGVPIASAPAPVAAPADPRHKLVSGTDIYLGMMPVEKISGAKSDIPSGKGYYHLNISLADKQVAGAGDRRAGEAAGLRRDDQREQDARPGGGQQRRELWQLLPLLERQRLQHHGRDPAPGHGRHHRGEVRFQGAVGPR